MKRTLWMAAGLLSAVMISGCGGKEQSGSNATAGAAKPQAPAATAPPKLSFKSSTPQEAVTEFLNALRGGDKETTAALLTAKAREETTAHDLVVEPPGAPNATYTVGNVEPVEGEPGAVYVACIWTENEAGNDPLSFEVVWIVRQENTGWRIAGMATRLPDTDEPVVLNFEDLSELEDAMRQAEMAERPQSTQSSDTNATTVR